MAAGDEFERKLYLVRKRATQRIWAESITNFYMPSLSSKTVVYKGLFMAPQLPVFYTDLNDPDYRTAIAVFHQRYSTNTFPTWERAQPFRMLCHNGEINTLQGNLTWMRAREADLGHSDIWGADAAVLAPVISPHGSDSAKMDNALDLLVQSGRDIRHAMMMLAPKAWEKPTDVTPEQRAFYRYHSCLQEPWDGPAALSFTDGVVAGCMLDRNGLRPARFTVMDDGLVVMASEVGAIELDERRVVQKGRLRPGEMIAVDTSTGAVENDASIVARFVERQPYGQWLDENMVTLDEVRQRTESVFRSTYSVTPGAGEQRRGGAEAQGSGGVLARSGGSRHATHNTTEYGIRNTQYATPPANHSPPSWPPSATPARSCWSSCARCGRRAASRSARWAMTRPPRRSPMCPGRCFTISGSVSPR